MNLGMKPMRYIDLWKDEVEIQENPVTAVGIAGRFKLDRISSSVWRLLDGRHTVNEIIDIILTEYPEASRERIEKDVITLLTRFEKDDLVILDYDPLYPNRELNIFREHPELFNKEA